MYYIIDLATNARYTCDTKLDVIWHYAVLCDCRMRYAAALTLSFDNLNITGHDIRMVRVPVGCQEIDGDFYTVYERQPYLRRYQVVDDADRSIDIRTWNNEIEAFRAGERPARKHDTHKPVFRREPCGYGRKRTACRVGLPAMWKASMVEAFDYADDEPLEYAIILDHSKPRHRGFTVGAGWDAYDDRYHAIWHSSKCWKDQSKSGRQWAKHKRGCSKRALRESVDIGTKSFDAEALIQELAG